MCYDLDYTVKCKRSTFEKEKKLYALNFKSNITEILKHLDLWLSKMPSRKPLTRLIYEIPFLVSQIHIHIIKKYLEDS